MDSCFQWCFSPTQIAATQFLETYLQYRKLQLNMRTMKGAVTKKIGEIELQIETAVKLWCIAGHVFVIPYKNCLSRLYCAPPPDQGLLHHVLCIEPTSVTDGWAPSDLAHLHFELTNHYVVTARRNYSEKKKKVFSVAIMWFALPQQLQLGMESFCPWNLLLWQIPFICLSHSSALSNPRNTTLVAKIANRVPINKQKELKPEQQIKTTFT